MRTWIPKVYDLDKNRVRELKYFCRQYKIKKRKIGAIRGGMNEFRIENGGSGGGIKHSQTESRAIKVMESKDARDIQMIESAALEAAEESVEIQKAILLNVTDAIPYERMVCHIGRAQFYGRVRKFYWLLDKKQNEEM